MVLQEASTPGYGGSPETAAGLGATPGPLREPHAFGDSETVPGSLGMR
jgi:hypothetical protein